MLALSGHAQPREGLSADIPAQPLSSALTAFARQTGVQLVYVSSLLRGQQSRGAPAGLAPDVALAHLLEGTGLRFEHLNARSVRILGPPAEGPAPAERRPGASLSRGARADEVIVTASALGAPADRVPLSLAVWTHEEMQGARITDLAALAALTPGVEFDSYPDYGAGLETNVAIRGINARDGSTTAVYRDDIPLPSDRLSAFGRIFPATFDLERVEVLRGPQGVLLGEGAEGGGVRFVSTPPSRSDFSGFATADFASTERGDVSYAAGAAAGGPVAGDLVGVRVGGWYRHDGGYVDRVDPFTLASVDARANRDERGVMNVALTYAPIAALRITAAANYETSNVHDTSAFYTYLSDPGHGILHNGKLLQQPYSDAHTIGSLTLDADVGGLSLRSTTAYVKRHATAIFDGTNNYFWFWPNPMGPEYPLSYADAKPDPVWLDQRFLSEVLELARADPTAQVQWRAGAEYVHVAYADFQDIVTSALSDGGFIDGATAAIRSTLQAAAYARADLHLRRGWSVSAGARVEHDSFASSTFDGGIGGGLHNQTVLEDGAATPVAGHLGVAYAPTDRALYFANLDKGFRAGGPNPSVGGACGPTPDTYGPDSIWSVELGAKLRTASERLSVYASVFHMVWRDVQLQVPYPSCGYGYTTNAGRAVSDGIDLGAVLEATEHLRLTLTAAYANPHATETVNGPQGVVVNRDDAIGALPLVAVPWTAVGALEYRRPAGDYATARLRAQGVVHSRNPGPFTTQNPDAIVYAPERGSDPPTAQFDLLAGLDWRRLALQAFVTNALDSRPTLQRRNRIPGDTLFYATTFRPRTVGVSANWHFGQAPAD